MYPRARQRSSYAMTMHMTMHMTMRTRASQLDGLLSRDFNGTHAAGARLAFKLGYPLRGFSGARSRNARMATCAHATRDPRPGTCSDCGAPA